MFLHHFRHFTCFWGRVPLNINVLIINQINSICFVCNTIVLNGTKFLDNKFTIKILLCNGNEPIILQKGVS